jgi:hypothetical protein
MRATRASLRLLAASGLAVAAAGCYTVTPFGSINTIATGGQNYIGVRGSQVFPASEGLPEQARAALDDLNVRTITRRRENETTVLEGTDTKGHRAVVRLRPESDGTKVSVHARFGFFGDEALSRAYLDRLAARVGQAEGDDKVRVASGEASPPLKLRADGAVAPPGSFFPRRLDEGVREIPYP